MRTVIIDGRTYYWRDVLRLRREQHKAERQPQPTLFELQSDSRPVTQKTATDRYLHPKLFEKGRQL